MLQAIYILIYYGFKNEEVNSIIYYVYFYCKNYFVMMQNSKIVAVNNIACIISAKTNSFLKYFSVRIAIDIILEYYFPFIFTVHGYNFYCLV